MIRNYKKISKDYEFHLLLILIQVLKLTIDIFNKEKYGNITHFNAKTSTENVSKVETRSGDIFEQALTLEYATLTFGVVFTLRKIH